MTDRCVQRRQGMFAATMRSSLVRSLPTPPFRFHNDFDFSGFVGAPYATSPDELHISTVKQRFYRRCCIHNANVLAAARQLRDERPQLISAITSTPGLDGGTQRRAIGFLDGFFSDITTDGSVNSKISKGCLGFNP